MRQVSFTVPSADGHCPVGNWFSIRDCSAAHLGDVDFIAQRIRFGRDKTEAGTGRRSADERRRYQTLLAWSGNFPERKDTHFVFPSEKVGAMGHDEVFGFTVASYGTDPTRPVGAIKTAWESARERTRPHCGCGKGKLQLIAAAKVYRCDSCGTEMDALPVACSKFRIHDLLTSSSPFPAWYLLVSLCP